MKSNPLVSILVPCYNSREFLKETLDSVLNQTYQNFELILVDDGPPDPIKDIADSFNSDKIRYYYIDNIGPANTRNLAAQKASGEYLAFLNHDDLWTPTKLEDQLNELDRLQAVWIASGSQRVNFYTHKVLERHEGRDYFKNVFYDILEKKHLWAFSTVMIRKDVFMDVGMFAGEIWFMDDRDLYLRVAKNYPIAYLSKVHLLDRVHSSNITSAISMEKMLNVHSTVLENARKLDDHIPDRVIKNSNRMIYQTVCIEYLRANNIAGVRKMVKLLDWDLRNIKFIPYRVLCLFNDQTIIKIMTRLRKARQKLNPSRIYPETAEWTGPKIGSSGQ